MKEELRQWLLRYGFLDFQDGLMQCGVQGFEDLVLLTQNDLQELSKVLGLNLVMKRKFLNAVLDITTPKLEIQQIIRKLQINSAELTSTLSNHCSLVCSLATKVSEINTAPKAAPRPSNLQQVIKRQQSFKRSRSQHFFSKMDLDQIFQSDPPEDEKNTLQNTKPVAIPSTKKALPVLMPSSTQVPVDDPEPVQPPAPMMPIGPKPPDVIVLAVIPHRAKIKVFIEPLHLEGVKYLVNVVTPNGEESLEFPNHQDMIIPNIQPGRSYKVKVAAKSEGGMVGNWSEREPVLVPLNKETIVILGGDVEYEENLDVTEYYADTEKHWIHDGDYDMNTERTRLGATCWRGSLVIVGGSERGMGHTNNVQMFNFSSKAWRQFPGTKFVRHSHSVGVVDGKLFCLGGYGTRGTNNKRYRFLDVLEIYDSSEKQWVVHPEKMSMPRKDFGCAVIDDEIFVAGGESNSRIIPDCEVFSFTSGRWMKIAPMNTKRRQPGSCEYGGRFWVAGGFQGGSKKKSILVSVEMYDPHEDVWLEMPELTEARYGCTLQKMNDKLMCIGGYDTKHDPVGTIEVYDFESNCWRRWKTRLIKKRGSHCAVVVEKWF